MAVNLLLLLIFGQCGNARNKTDSGSDEQGSLHWFTIQSRPYSLYSQFLNVGVLDGRNHTLSFL
jgi:hypothetical protein